MENEIRHYIESLNHDPQWVRRITNDINKLLVDSEYIDFFMQINIQWSTDNSYTSSTQTLIIECLPHFEKLALSLFKVYIEVEKWLIVMCAIIVKWAFSFNLLILKRFFCILQMLRIHTGLREWNKKDRHHILIRENNPMGLLRLTG